MKSIFRLVLQHLGPQAPLPTDSPLLAWCADEEGKEAVYRFRLVCSDLTRTLGVDETFASCLNKSGYWLASVGFWSSVLCQLWGNVLAAASGHEEKVQLLAWLPADCIKLSMNFFTYRFLYGAAVLAADIRKRTWAKKRSAAGSSNDCWNQQALLLLKSSCGVSICGNVAQRAGPMFRGLNAAPGSEARSQAESAYRDALEYLQLRGFGDFVEAPEHHLPVFCKRHYAYLSETCKGQLLRAGVPALLFGLHVLLEDVSVPVVPPVQSHPAEDKGPHPASSMPAIESNGPKPTPPKTSKAAPHIDSNGQNPTPSRKSEAPCMDRRDNARQAVARAALGPKPDAGTEDGDDGEPGQVLRRKTAPASCRDGAAAPLLEEDDAAAGTEGAQPWQVLHEGRPNIVIHTYSRLREEVERILGARKDPGVHICGSRGGAPCPPPACHLQTRIKRASAARGRFRPAIGSLKGQPF